MVESKIGCLRWAQLREGCEKAAKSRMGKFVGFMDTRLLVNEHVDERHLAINAIRVNRRQKIMER